MTAKRNEQELFGHDPELRRALDALTEGKASADPLYTAPQRGHVPDSSPTVAVSRNPQPGPRHFQSWTAPPGYLETVVGQATEVEPPALHGVSANGSTTVTQSGVGDARGAGSERPSDTNHRGRVARGLVIVGVSVLFAAIALISIFSPARRAEPRAASVTLPNSTAHQVAPSAPRESQSTPQEYPAGQPATLVRTASDEKRDQSSTPSPVRNLRAQTTNRKRVAAPPAEPSSQPSAPAPAAPPRAVGADPLFTRDPVHD